MRVAVLSDVHSNLRALEAVLAEIDAGGFDEIWFLGDLVGYGPKPNECAALLQERAAICLAGNHDLVVLGKIAIDAFAGEAAAAARWTQTVLDDTARSFLDTLQPQAVAPGAELFHGSPRDPVWDYVLARRRCARSRSRATSAPLVLVGHSHVALEISVGDELRGEPAAAGTTARARRRCGGCSTRARSVSRATATREPRGSRLTLGPGRATFRRTDYSVERTQAEMREVGLPEALALRLEFGI